MFGPIVMFVALIFLAWGFLEALPVVIVLGLALMIGGIYLLTKKGSGRFS